jgi:hypothetical protein
MTRLSIPVSLVGKESAVATWSENKLAMTKIVTTFKRATVNRSIVIQGKRWCVFSIIRTQKIR